MKKYSRESEMKDLGKVSWSKSLQHAGWEFCLISLFAMADEQQISEPARILLMNSLGFVLGLVGQFSRGPKLTEADKSTCDYG